MTDATKRQFQVLKAQIDLLRVQLETLEHALTEPPTATVARPKGCRLLEIPDEQCGYCEEDARISKASFASPNKWECRSCGLIEGAEING